METTVLYLCGFWFWLTRGFRMESYRDAAETLQAARAYLAHDFAARASTRDRGGLLADQVEALELLENHGRFAARSSLRFESLAECCRFVMEELTGRPARPITLPAREAFTSVALRSALTTLLPDTRSGAMHVPSHVAVMEAREPVGALPKAA